MYRSRYLQIYFFVYNFCPSNDSDDDNDSDGDHDDYDDEDDEQIGMRVEIVKYLAPIIIQ